MALSEWSDGNPRPTSRPLVIGLTGPGGVGKSTVARALCNRYALANTLTEAVASASTPSPVIIHIGAPLKAMLGEFYRHAGLSADHIAAKLDGDLKRKPCHLLGGQTPTHAMQTLGTDWGRKLIHHRLWLDCWRARAVAAMAKGRNVINDSVRFENEADEIRDLDGVVVGLVGRDGDLSATHVSEAGVVPDFEVANTGTPTETASAVLAAISNHHAILADAFAVHG